VVSELVPALRGQGSGRRHRADRFPEDFRKDILTPEFGSKPRAGETWGGFWKRLFKQFVEWYMPTLDNAEAAQRLLEMRMLKDETMDEYFDRYERTRMDANYACESETARRTFFLSTLPLDIKIEFQRATINTPLEDLTWSRFREMLCNL